MASSIVTKITKEEKKKTKIIIKPTAALGARKLNNISFHWSIPITYIIYTYLSEFLYIFWQGD